MTPGDALDALLATLEQLQDAVPTDKESWDAAEEYRRSAGIDVGVEPWAELTGFRNRLAHALPGDLPSDRIWADTAADLTRILDVVRNTGL